MLPLDPAGEDQVLGLDGDVGADVDHGQRFPGAVALGDADLAGVAVAHADLEAGRRDELDRRPVAGDLDHPADEPGAAHHGHADGQTPSPRPG